MPTLLQKLRLSLRGWSRRREEKQRAFLARNAGWGVAQEVPAAAQPRIDLRVDLEGLTVAYLDDSGQFHHYLDVETGEVIDASEPLSGERYRPVPSRDAQSDFEDRQAFVAGLEPSESRDRLAASLGVPEAFRRAIAGDRKIERAWYNFRNDRAIALIQSWLRT